MGTEYISRPTAQKITGLERTDLVILLEKGVIEAYKREDNAWMISRPSVESYVKKYGKGKTYDSSMNHNSKQNVKSDWSYPDYMLLKFEMCKVKLCSKNNAYVFPIAGRRYTITASMERFYVYTLFVGTRLSFIEELRYLCSGRDLTPMDIDAAIDQFYKDHPTTPIETYSYSDLPLYADAKYGLDLPIPGYSCTISTDQEKEVMDTFLKYPYSQVIPQIRTWFRRYLNRYAISIKNMTDNEAADYLMSSFFQQRGVRVGSIPADKVAIEEAKKQNEKDLAKAKAMVWLCFFGIEALACLFFWFADLFNKADSFFGEGLCLVIAFVLLVLPFNILRGDFKK